MLSSEQFMVAHDFPIPFKESKSTTDAIPSGIRLLMKNHQSYGNKDIREFSLMLDCVELSDKKKNNNNKHIRRHLQKSSNSIAQRGMFYWDSLISDINWKKTWPIPHKYCISNKAKEVHFKLLHNIYLTNYFVAKFLDIDTCCSFCKQDTETIPYLFFNCPVTKRF